MATPEWQIPPPLRPEPGDWRFDLDRALHAIVGVRAAIPEDAFTAGILGTERSGSGVVIGERGLVVTIGYLVTEAETIWLTTGDGRAIAGHALGYDYETGFGLVQALGRLDLPVLELGEPGRLAAPDRVILASAGGRRHALAASVVARHEFAGYWEYLIDDAIFTAPAHPFWGGAGLIGEDGRLYGIGSLHVEQSGEGSGRQDMNMVVPVELLPPVLRVLRDAAPPPPPRPWLGLYAAEAEQSLVVAGIAADGPAAQAGIEPGDRLLRVGGAALGNLASLWRAVRACGDAGATVPIELARNGDRLAVTVRSGSRADFLKSPKLH